MKTEKFKVTCVDGVVLQGLLLIPNHPKAVVQFNGGTAAKKEFYLPFLKYLAGQGYACCLWDYRGSGESAPASLKGCTYTYSDYGQKDMPAIKNFMKERFPELPYFIFAHSAGGQQVGFMDNLEGIDGMVAFAVSTGYMPYMPLRYRTLSAYFFFIFTPLSIFLFGYLKAKKFGYMEDLPKNVVQEWKVWCLKKNYFFDKKFYGVTVPEGNFKKFQFPIHVFWTTDDPISNKRALQQFWSNCKSEAGIRFTRLQPSEYKVKSIGHMGFFRKKMQDNLWPQALLKLELLLNSYRANQRE